MKKKKTADGKKRIVFVDQNLNGGGAERVLCTILRSLDPAEFDIHLMLVGQKGKLGFLIPAYVAVHELNIGHTKNALFSTVKKIREVAPDVVFTSLGRISLLCVMVRLFCPPFLLVARYASMPSREIEDGSLRGWRLILLKKLYRFADVFIAQSEEMARELEQIMSIPKDKIKTIDNPIDTAAIDTALQDMQNPFSKNFVNIVASGRLVPLKGFDILIEAVALLIRDNPSFHLYLLGADEANNLNNLQQQAARLAIEENIHFLGFQKNPYPYYRDCNVFVLSSRYEGFPNVLLECLYIGTPVVATRCVPIVERLIDNGINGYMVEVDDIEGMAEAIQKALLLRPLPSKDLGQNGKILQLFK